MRSGFVALVGRTGVGKSTLINALVGAKVSITSRHPNTTRTPVQGVLSVPGVQAVFVDTPGIHRPKTRLGHRLNESAGHALAGVDLVVMVVDASAPIGPGDETVATRVREGERGGVAICVVNKVDKAGRGAVVAQLARAGEWEFSDYFAVSAKSGEGIAELSSAILERLPEGPAYYPEGIVSDTPEAAWVAELVREALLSELREELPHSLACRVTDWDGSYIRCEVIVERESQKPIVIGRGARVLKKAGMAARAQLPEGIYLDLVVRVARDWQSRDEMIDRFGYGGS